MTVLLHPRNDLSQFTDKVPLAPENAVHLVAPADTEPQPMDTAPRNGEVFEAPYEGDWFEVRWSGRAYDGSPYGCTGWMDIENGCLQLDLEGWRESAEYQFVDEYAESVARQTEAEESAEADRKTAARVNRRPRRTKAQMAEARVWEAGRAERTAEALSSFMRGFGL